MRFDAEGFIEKAINEDAKHSDGKSCFIHIEATVHLCSSGKQGGNEESCDYAENYRHDDSEDTEAADGKSSSGGIVEQKVADKGSQCR